MSTMMIVTLIFIITLTVISTSTCTSVSLQFQEVETVSVACVQQQDNYCECTLDDGTKRFFDLSPISSKNGPFFEIQTEDNVYYYDPCEPFTVAESGDVCKDVAGCHMEKGESVKYSAIGLHKTVVFNYFEESESLVLYYDNDKSDESKINMQVILSRSADDKSVLEVISVQPTVYQFQLFSPYSTLQSPSGKDGLSVGSILCIIFSVLVFVYITGGFIFTMLVQHKKGIEAFPNYDFWKEVPDLIKEGTSFSVSCVTRKGGSTTSAPVPEDQEADDTFSGGSGKSTGNTKYDAI